jgi:hypothetical protein
MKLRSKSLSRERSTRDKDRDFLARTLNGPRGPFTEREKELITGLVNRHHEFIYEEINQILHSPYRTLHSEHRASTEVMLDNLDYLLGKVKGRYTKQSYAYASYHCYGFAPDLLVMLRHAPVALRRKAVVSVKLKAMLDEAVNLPDGSYSDHGDGPSINLMGMGVKHWKRIDQMIDLILDERMLRLAIIDTMMDDELVAPLSSGVL